MPTLGVCLGHQSLAQAFGGDVVRHVPVHGKTTEITHEGTGLFEGLPIPLDVGRYHSLVVDPDAAGLPDGHRHAAAACDGRAAPRAAGRTASSSTPSRCSRPRASACWRTSLPNPVLTEAIDRLASREDLPADDMAAVLAEIMAGNASETETAAVLIALRTKGETVDELVGLARDDAALRRAGQDRARRPDRHRGHRRRAPDVQRLHDRGADRRGRRLRGRQARQPLRHRPVAARPTCSRRSACASTSRRRPSRGASSEVGFGFMFAPAHHGATRFVVPGAQGARRAHDLQLPRPADEPGGRDAPGDRRVRPGRSSR